MFALLLVAVCIIFSIMAFFYTYVDPEELFKDNLELTVKEDDAGDFPKKKQTDEVHLNRIESSTKM